MELLRELTRLQAERGHLDEASLAELAERTGVPLYRLEGLVSFYPHFRRTPAPEREIQICRDVCCAMGGSAALAERLLDELTDRTGVELYEVSCLGRCEHAPAVAVDHVPLPQPGDYGAIARYLNPSVVPSEPGPAAARVWKCDPYGDGSSRYRTVRELARSPRSLGATCIERLTAAGLGGMGGAGFPTGRKWDLVAREPTLPKYIVCNADESEPGTFKDRVILEELPHLVIEGMVLGALTVRAEHGIVYLRHEYAKERRSLERAIAEARLHGILGENTAGSGQVFDVEIFVSPGGYILGEETALLEALEDKRGEPRNKPPYPGTHGLWGQPTLINNVETFALATAIVHHGSEWWKSQGREGFAGLKFVAISGDVDRPGVYEIAIGTTVAELIGIAGGMKNGRRLKAFLPGGASSNFLTAADADTPLDFESMKKAGSMLGTGAVIVFSEDRDLFEAATNIVRFFRNESCGKCVPCRLGTEVAVELLEGVRDGNTTAADLALLPELGATLQQTSICGLGQVAINPILSMMRKFPDDVPSDR